MGDECANFPFDAKFTVCFLVKCESDEQFSEVLAGIPHSADMEKMIVS